MEIKKTLAMLTAVLIVGCSEQPPQLAFLMCPNLPIVKGEMRGWFFYDSHGDRWIHGKDCNIVIPKQEKQK